MSVDLDTIIAVGFGSAFATKDGKIIYDEQDIKDNNYSTIRDIEALAAKSPDHIWEISINGPTYGVVIERKGVNNWVVISKNKGFI